MTRRSLRTAGWIGMLAVVLASPVALEAQQRGQRGQGRGGPPQARADLENRIRQRFGQMIQQRLGLTDEEAQRLGEVMEGFREPRGQLMREEQALRQRVSAVLLEGGPSEEEAAGLLDRLLELRERELSLFRSEQEALRDLLTPYQVLQFHALREQLNERIRALGQQPGMRRRGGGPGPPGAGGPGGGPLGGPEGIHPIQGG